MVIVIVIIRVIAIVIVIVIIALVALLKNNDNDKDNSAHTDLRGTWDLFQLPFSLVTSSVKAPSSDVMSQNTGRYCAGSAGEIM